MSNFSADLIAVLAVLPMKQSAPPGRENYIEILIATYDHICWSNVTIAGYLQGGKSSSSMSNLIISNTTGFYCTL